MTDQPEILEMALKFNSLADHDQAEIDRMTRDLLQQIEKLDVDKVELAHRGTIPIGAKAGEEVFAIGEIIVGVVSPLMPNLLNFLRSWLQRNNEISLHIQAKQPGIDLDITLDPSKLSDDQWKKILSTVQSLRTSS